MTTECCKFCGAEAQTVVRTPFAVFKCGTVRRTSGRIDRHHKCLASVGARYEALFPIPPLSNEPITAEVCERLGMEKNSELSWHIEDFWCVVRYYEDVNRWEVAIEGKYQKWCTTAHQLSLLIAARKGAVK